MYMQRYMDTSRRRGEIVILDRSWYNRAGSNTFMGFCTKEQYKGFLELAPSSKSTSPRAGIKLIKYWLEVSNKEQERRFQAHLKMRYASGSSVRWICLRGRNGTSIRAHAIG